MVTFGFRWCLIWCWFGLVGFGYLLFLLFTVLRAVGFGLLFSFGCCGDFGGFGFYCLGGLLLFAV